MSRENAAFAARQGGFPFGRLMLCSAPGPSPCHDEPPALRRHPWSAMAEYRHFVFTLLLLLAVLATFSLVRVFTYAALYVLGFAALSAAAYLWGDRHRRRLRRP